MTVVETGEVNSASCYTLAELERRTGLKRDAMRSARRAGLRVVYKHNRGYVMGRDWLAYLDGKTGSGQ